jgi:hypothetical protein
VAGAVAVLRPPGQVRAPGGLPGPAALHRGGVNDPDVIGPDGGTGRQDPDAVPDHGRGSAQPLVIARLLGQVREQVPQVRAGMPQPPGLGGEPQQGLQHGQGDQLGVAQPQVKANLRPAWRELR